MLTNKCEKFFNIILWFSVVDGTRQSPVIGKIFKDGKQLTSKDVEINVTDDKVTYTFKKPTSNQSGKYQIKLSNEQGEDTKEININMQGITIFFHISPQNAILHTRAKNIVRLDLKNSNLNSSCHSFSLR